MLTYDEAVAKIQKLLRLSDSPNPNEAAQAAAAAQSIMDKYNIEMSAVQMTQEDAIPTREEDIEDFHKKEGGELESGEARLSTWKTCLANVISRANGCRVVLAYRWDKETYKHYPTVELIGRASDVRTVRYLYDWLKQEIEKMATHAAKGHGKTWSNSFRLGCVDTISTKLREAKQATVQDFKTSTACTALVVSKAIEKWENRVNEVSEWMENNMKNLKNKPSTQVNVNYKARLAGQKAAEKLSIGNARGSLGNGAAQLR